MSKTEDERNDRQRQYDTVDPCSGHEELDQLISRPEQTPPDDHKEKQDPEQGPVHLSG